jgi:hypothetical protein
MKTASETTKIIKAIPSLLNGQKADTAPPAQPHYWQYCVNCGIPLWRDSTAGNVN